MILARATLGFRLLGMAPHLFGDVHLFDFDLPT
jgi:hypothetical protein